MGELSKSLAWVGSAAGRERLLSLTAPIAESMRDAIARLCSEHGVATPRPAPLMAVRYEWTRERNGEKFPVEPGEHLAAAGMAIGIATSWISADGIYGRDDRPHFGRAGHQLALAVWHLAPDNWGKTLEEFE